MSRSRVSLVTALPIGLYAAAIPLVSNLQIDRSVRLYLFQNRSYFVFAAAAGALIGLTLFASSRVERAFRTPWHRQLIGASLAFPLFYTAASLIKGRIIFEVIGLYFVWSLSVFLILPLLLGSRRGTRSVALALFLANLFAWLLGYYLFQAPGAKTTFVERESFGYSNPNAYAQILQIIACTAIYLQVVVERGQRRKRGTRATLFCVLLGCAYFIWGAGSRNVMVFGIAAGTVFVLISRRRGRPILSATLLALLAVSSIFILGRSDYREIDAFSSSRLTIWNRTVEAAFTNTDDASAFLFGIDRDISREISTGGYSDIRGGTEFDKFHVDNFYLELMVEGGLVGTLLFLWPYALLVLMLWRLRADPEERLRANLVLAFVGGLAVQGNFISTIPSFNNPIGFTFAVMVTSVLASGLGKRAVVRAVPRSLAGNPPSE